MNDWESNCLPILYAVNPFSANAKSKSSIAAVFHEKSSVLRQICAPFSPSASSCHMILAKSDPPTKPIATFFLRSRSNWTISGSAFYLELKHMEDQSSKADILDGLESEFRRHRRGLISLWACQQNRVTPYLRAM
jgi:hypothetical protein